MAKQKICEIIALEKGKKSKADTALTAAYQTLSKPDLFKGLSRVYNPLTEENEQYPSEITLAQVSLRDLIKDAFEPFKEFLDISAVRDYSNQVAKADIIINEQVLVENVPITYLLLLEKRLTDIKTFISKLPTLDPSDTWTYNSDKGCYVSAPTEKASTRKIPRAFVKAEATKEHPAQVEVVHEDVRQGTWVTTKFSSALKVDEVKTMLAKVDALSDAVKSARERTNSELAVEIPHSVGDQILNYIFNTHN